MKKRFLSLALALCLVLTLLPGTALAAEVASGACGDNVTWSLDDAGTLTISGTGAMEDYTHYTSESPPWQEHKSAVKAIQIQSGVTRIGSWAFANCTNLTSVTIPNSVSSIGHLAFWQCSSLPEIAIPNTVTSIEYRAFDSCGALASVNIPRGMTKIENSVFFNCSSLTSITIPENITSIGEFAFDFCTKLKSVVLPDNLTALGRSAFSGCASLESITIPEGVTSIGEYTFSGCSSLVDLVIPSKVTSIDMYAFRACTSLKSVTIPVGITKIPGDAFDSCDNLADVYYSGTKAQWNQITIGLYNDSLKTAAIHCSDGVIGAAGSDVVASGECGAQGDNVTWTLDKAGTLTISGTGAMKDYFFGLTTNIPWTAKNVKKIVMSSKITHIGDGAFQDCNVTSFEIPSTVETIGEFAFANTKLTSVTIPGNVKVIENGCFSNCFELTQVILQEGLDDIGIGAFSNCEITSVRIPASVSFVGAEAFGYCDSLATITVAAGNPYGFYAADGVLFRREPGEVILVQYPAGKANASYEVPSNVTWILDSAFAGCDGLTSVSVPGSVKLIADSAFCACGNLTSATLAEGVEELEFWVFLRCWELRKVEIPQSLTAIPDGTFLHCRALTDVYYGGTKAQWGNMTIGPNNEEMVNATIHCSDGDIVPEGGGYTYEIITQLGTLDPETGHYTMPFDGTGTMVISAPSDELMDLYLDGEKLVRDSDYTLDLGSTASLSVTIPHHVASGKHTISAEFREGGQADGPLHRVTQEFAIWPENPIVLRNGYVGVSYSYEFNDNWTYHELWDADEFLRLPDGLTLDGKTGVISGTPTKAGTWYFHIDAYSQGAGSGAQAYKLTVKEAIEPEYKQLPGGVRYVPYSEHIKGDDFQPGENKKFQCEPTGTLPNGLSLDPDGVISGVPMAAGTWKFPVMCQWVDISTGKTDGEPWEEFYQLTVAGNTDAAVQKPNDYPIIDPVGTPDTSRPGHFYKDAYTEETLVIDGPFAEFTRLLIDGKKQEEGEDYTAREGSTVITIRAQTFRKMGEGTHTIAAEFRAGGAPDGALKRASQNYTLSLPRPSGGSGGGSGGGGGSYPTRETSPKPAEPKPQQPEKKPGLPFTDVSPADWFYDDVVWAYEEGVMLGVSDTLFAPQREVSQATIVTVLARLAKVDPAQFQDEAEPGIQAGRSFTGAAIWAKRAGLLPEGPFTGDETTTRNQMAVMLVKYLTSMGKDTMPPAQPAAFADAEDMTREGNDAFQVLYRDGIFKGVGGLRMNASGSTTRAHFVALIHRIYETAMSET